MDIELGLGEAAKWEFRLKLEITLRCSLGATLLPCSLSVLVVDLTY